MSVMPSYTARYTRTQTLKNARREVGRYKGRIVWGDIHQLKEGLSSPIPIQILILPYRRCYRIFFNL
ncbi:hypothetical protein CBM2634_U220012 [Cupriavidus taiwanensis]|uniref:Uncharacterized protein n=1 Tax=Cupriavidus taiwanensis TaxID=164546 RepID=A0A375JC75_9BURK|nr:hypothetical protein CBM2634_U220012 [Cupriavidus taiwanensis]